MLIDRTTTALWEIQGRNGVSARSRYRSTNRPVCWTRPAIEIAVERVNRGAVLLEGTNPHWVEEVIPQDLDMSDPGLCMVGQTYGDYNQIGLVFGLEVLDGEYDPDDFDYQAVEHGFLEEAEFRADEDFVPYELLDRVWVYMLFAHKDRGAPVTLELPVSEPQAMQEQLVEQAELFDHAVIGDREFEFAD